MMTFTAFILISISAIIITWIILATVTLVKAQQQQRTRKRPSLLLVLGSGGHTAELIALVETLDPNKYDTVHWCVANTDITSLPRLHKNESRFVKEAKSMFHTIPRSREVKQNWITTIWTTIKAMVVCIWLVFDIQPNIVIVNGPGTCVPICAGAMLLRFITMGWLRPQIIFVESFCRVNSLSLTGRILYPIADHFIVQWSSLATKYKKAKYLGVIY